MAPSISTTQQSYTLAGLLSLPAHRLDNRSLLAFRPLHVSTGIAPQAAGSAQCLLGGTKCTVVASAEVVDGQDASGPYMSCDVDCPSSIPQGTNLASLLLSLNKTLTSTLNSSAIPSEQFVVLRSPSPPYTPTKAWSLHLDVTFTNIQGGNLADVMYAAVWAALNNVRLPQTRAIGFDTDLLSNRQNQGNLDSFDIKGTRTISRGVQGKGPTTNGALSSSGNGSAVPDKTGVDFEMADVWDSGAPIKGADDFPVAVTVNLLPSGVLLDATLSEEACMPTSRRLLVLCSPTSGKVAGVQTIPATLDTAASGSSEDTSKGVDSIPGTADYKSIRQSMRDGQEFARSLHGAIKSQMTSSGGDTTMQTV